MTSADLHSRNQPVCRDVLNAMTRTTIVSRTTDIVALYKDPGMGATLALGSVALVAAVHALLSGHPAIEALYLLPAWLAFRAGGRKQGALLLALCAFTATVMSAGGFATLALIYRTLAFFAVGTVVAITADARSKKQQPKEFENPSSDDDRPMVAVMIDCEGFVSLDDFYGEGSGDHVTSMLVRSLELETRQSDMIARLKPSEFVLILNDTDTLGASRIMERVQARFEQSVVDAGYECTISFGCSPVETEASTIQDLLDSTDQNAACNQAYLN